jgi:GNAT superfamily N-acetyltransferase
MEGPRSPRENEFSHVLEFLNKNLRPEASWSIAKEYPTALSANNLGNLRIISDGDKVVSHAVLKPLIVRTPSILYKIGAIGSVVTDRECRGQGLSSQVLQDCLTQAKEQECDIALLWTNLFDFYRRLNFELAGCEQSVVLMEDFASNPQGLRFVKGNAVDAEAILRLYMKHSVATIRNMDEIRKFLHIPNTILYTAWDTSGQLAAFAVEGKGADLSGYVHEWGGTVSRLLPLFAWIRAQRQSPITIILGKQSQNLAGALREIPGALFNEGYLGMIKLVNEEQLFAKVLRAAKNIGIFNLVLEKKDDEYYLGVGTDVVQFPDEKDMIRVLFGPLPEIPYLKAETLEVIERVLPLPLWLWGWDSI